MQSFFQFIEKSPTGFHAVEEIASMLVNAGAEELYENSVWTKEKVKPGKAYFVRRNGSSVIAFFLPDKKTEGYHIYAAHSDSPCFKLKENPEMSAENLYGLLNVEKYGGMILSTWLDRPLGIAGRVTVLENETLVTKLVNLKEYTLIIPNVAIHMNRDMNKGVEYNAQTDMRPLYCLQEEKTKILSLAAKKLKVAEEDILGQDLYVYAKDKCTVIGVDESMIAGPRLDDLECAYAGAKAFVEACAEEKNKPSQFMKILAVFDNEEVGSSTKQGADSTFLTDVLERLEYLEGLNPEEIKCKRANSFMISADNAHAVHPNHPEKADPTNRPVLNGGIVIKFHGGQKYTTDACSEAVMKTLCKKAGVAYQTYANRSDIAGGSTLGNIVTAHLSIASADIGLPQLAMHSAYETAGAKDLDALCLAARVFFEE